MTLFNRAQADAVDALLKRGMSDFDIARQICATDEDPELFLEAVSNARERSERICAR